MPGAASQADALRRWAAAHAATVGQAGTASPGPVPGPAAPAVAAASVSAVLSSFTQVATIDTGFWTNAVAWNRHPDGRLLLAAAGAPDAWPGSVGIWDYASGSRLIDLTWSSASRGTVSAVTSDIAWGRGTSGEPLLAAVCADGGVRVWDADTGELVAVVPAGRRSAVSGASGSVAWGSQPDGRMVLAAAAKGDSDVWLWSPDDPGRPQRLASYEGEVNSLAWARQPGDGDPVLAVGEAGGTVQLSRPGTGQFTQVLAGTIRIDTLRWSSGADGTLLLAAGGFSQPGPSGTRVLEVAGAQCTEVLSTSSSIGVSGLAWGCSGDGRSLLAETFFGVAEHSSLNLYDAHTMQLLLVQDLGCNTGGNRQVDWAVTPDGQLLLAVGSREKKVHIWEAVLDPPVPRPAAPARAVAPLAGHPAAGRPAAGNRRANRPAAKLLDPFQDVTPEFEVGNDSGGTGGASVYRVRCAVRDDGHLLIAATSQRGIPTVWDGTTGALLYTLTGAEAEFGQLAWGRLADGRLVLATPAPQGERREGGALLWDASTGSLINRVSQADAPRVTAVAWIKDRDERPLLVTAHGSGAVNIWDPMTGDLVRELAQAEANFVLAEGRLADGAHCLVTDPLRENAEIWDLDTGRLIRRLPTAEPGLVNSGIAAATWCPGPDGRAVLVISRQDGSLEWWDPDSGELLRSRSGHQEDVQTLAAVNQPGLPAILISAAIDGQALIWDQATVTQLAELPRLAPWSCCFDLAVDTRGDLLLVTAQAPGAEDSGAIRVLNIATTDEGDHARPPGPGGHQAGDVASRLTRLGAGGLWPPAGLAADLVTLTGPAGPDAAGGGSLSDTRLGALADEAGITRLRALAAGEPAWAPDSRTTFAALLTQSIDIPGQYQPPAGTEPAELRAALAAALAARPPDTPASPWPVPLTELRAAAATVTDQVITLLAILGPGACAADTLLPLRLAHQLPQLPALSPRELRLLAAAAGHRGTRGTAATGTTWSPGTAGLTRTGPLTRLLPTQLALPPSVLAIRLAEDQLLYRQHRAPAPPTPEPVTIILDTTPATFGPAGNTLRLAAHLITLTLWHHGHHPTLITLDQPGAATELRTPADLLAIWTSGTLDNPAASLDTARTTAAALGQAGLLCTHYRTARDHSRPPTPATRLLTTHQPPDKPPPRPASPWHAHLPPDPTHEQVSAAIGRLLTAGPGAGRGSG